MKIRINQVQDRSLLEEHANSSSNFYFLGKHELFIAIAVFLIGVLLLVFLDNYRLLGVPLILIGLLEIIEFPTREKRWVNKKVNENIFNKLIEFEISDDVLKIFYDDKLIIHKFGKMRKCLISETGILFKITFREYYYISFKSIQSDVVILDLIENLKSQFTEGKIKVKRTQV